MAGSVNQTPSIVQRALSGHAAIGLLAGALLYLICISGMLAVVQQHWQRWEEPGVSEMTAIAPEAVQRGFEQVIAQQGKATTHAYAHMPTEGLPRVVITTDHGASYIDAKGNPERPEAHAWTEFMLFLHYQLNLPPVWGLMLVGGLGVMMMALAVTGVVAHPRIFRDAFRMRLRGGGQLARADLHNRLGVWLIPFTIAIAFTGAAIGLGQIVFQATAIERHGNDIEHAYAPLFGDHPAMDESPAPLARVDRAIAWMAANHPDRRLTYITIEEPLTKGQQISVLADHDQRLIYGESYIFDGDGNFRNTVGLSDGKLGQQAIASVYKLHFGSYGGLAIEIAYILFGLALCAITATGMTIWLMKRRARGRASPRLESFWAFIVWGSPLLLVLAYWLRVVAGADAPLVGFFWVVLALGSLTSLIFPVAGMEKLARTALGISMAITGVGHAAFAGALPMPSAIIDLLLVATGLTLAASAVRAARRRSDKPSQPVTMAS